jgi:hypothetical protein
LWLRREEWNAGAIFCAVILARKLQLREFGELRWKRICASFAPWVEGSTGCGIVMGVELPRELANAVLSSVYAGENEPRLGPGKGSVSAQLR